MRDTIGAHLTVFNMHYHALISVGTSNLLTLHNDITTINFLDKNTTDTLAVPFVDFPNYQKTYWFKKKGYSFLSSLDPTEYPLWTWNKQSRTFVKTRDDVATDDMRARSALATAKADAFTKVTKDVSLARMRAWDGVMFQDTVYQNKRMEAQACKDAGYDESRAGEWTFVVQYADFANISLRTAADEILLKAAMNDEFLARTELIRLTLFSKIKNARDPNELPLIVKESDRMCWNENLY